jgi:hypothetical protein
MTQFIAQIWRHEGSERFQQYFCEKGHPLQEKDKRMQNGTNLLNNNLGSRTIDGLSALKRV